jgi:GNAT superfamily N-acetyltransferase
MTIRSATVDDFDEVTRLLERLGRPRVTNRNRAAAKEVFGAQLADADADHLVAVTDRGRIVGFCSLHYRSRLSRIAPQAWIPELIVDEAARGGGVARALLGAAEDRARGLGCFEVTLEASHARREDHVLYAAAGMEDAGTSFRKSLDDG